MTKMGSARRRQEEETEKVVTLTTTVQIKFFGGQKNEI